MKESFQKTLKLRRSLSPERNRGHVFSPSFSAEKKINYRSITDEGQIFTSSQDVATRFSNRNIKNYCYEKN